MLLLSRSNKAPQARRCLVGIFMAVLWLCLTVTSSVGQPTAQPTQPTQPTAQAPGQAISVLPTDTDTAITSFNQPHMCWLPGSPARNQLLVFLPGTNGSPHQNFPFARVAAGSGYHVISLEYPDTVAAQQACTRSADPDAYMNFRLDVIESGNSSKSVSISQADCIYNRLAKLLQYLDRQQPTQGWRQFLTADNGIDWSKVVISGHSQGGGHACVIAKLNTCARVILFGSPKDFSHYFNKPANGFDAESKTPAGRYFALNHIEDVMGACNHDQQMEIFNAMGLTKLGIARIDQGPSAEFNHAHLLFTDVQLADMTNKTAVHCSVITNRTAEANCGTAWKYMLTTPVE